jgi:hypothetical protein
VLRFKFCRVGGHFGSLSFFPLHTGEQSCRVLFCVCFSHLNIGPNARCHPQPRTNQRYHPSHQRRKGRSKSCHEQDPPGITSPVQCSAVRSSLPNVRLPASASPRASPARATGASVTRPGVEPSSRNCRSSRTTSVPAGSSGSVLIPTALDKGRASSAGPPSTTISNEFAISARNSPSRRRHLRARQNWRDYSERSDSIGSTQVARRAGR